MKSLKYVLPILMFSTCVNASVINTLSGIQYEWLELNPSDAFSLSRNAVESELANTTSNLYGYQYASRSLVEQLFTSYAIWDPEIGSDEGYSYNSDIITGISNLFNDFGTTRTNRIDAYYGATGECGTDTTCVARLELSRGEGGARVYQSKAYGWDSAYGSVETIDKLGDFDESPFYSSFLVRQAYQESDPQLPGGRDPAVVPLPAAAWLFGSALLGFFGFSRRKANA